MTSASESIRKTTTFLLAVFLWIHAFFLLNLTPTYLSRLATALKLTFSETLLVILLIAFSFLTSSGFWGTLKSLAYIYFFPFILFGYACAALFVIFRSINAWLLLRRPDSSVTLEQASTSPELPESVAAHPQSEASQSSRSFRFLFRPFQRFMLLWCLLLLVTTHAPIVWLCLLVVLVQLARRIWLILETVFFPVPWFDKVGPTLIKGTSTAIATAINAFKAVALDAPRAELERLWNQVHLWKSIVNFLNDRYLISAWAWLIVGVLLAFLYFYMAALFSFAYYGIARVNSISYSWPNALVTSLFIPFFVSDLPKVLAARLLGGIQCLLVVAVSVGTIVNFLRRKLDAFRKLAVEFNERLADQEMGQKYALLAEQFAGTKTPTTPP